MNASHAALLLGDRPAALAAGPVVATLAEARQWCGQGVAAPAAARCLRESGAPAVCIVDFEGGSGLHWLDTPHARGWLAPARAGGAAPGFAREWSAALARGFVAADAAVIALMACAAGADALRDGSFMTDPPLLPRLSWGEAARFGERGAGSARPIGLYPLVDSAQRVAQALAAGITTIQLRIKRPPLPDGAWEATLRREVEGSLAACRQAGAELYVNDHWRLALELGAFGVHLGQEDLVALGEDDRAALLAGGIALGVSSHSLWELCRAAALAPRYVACGPVWPTQTKDMPWLPQGLDNLAWWCRMAPAPVVAIGGILGPEQVRQAARSGADGVCIVRGLGEQPRQTVPPLQAALEAGRREHAAAPPPPAWPHPSLAPAH
ncbi:thiamine phosphate synthase [Ramlibacter sp.]|uniref:thiamine phosphate synthase n=1 Tax=Ramlibacter sp. TaxID=1917967 RepID=UPI002C02D3E6|nr:thiamine phosphate synthase [Ramlibacter sp.]HWI80839.1 thiamine phosphate synthase [Ramlibacter sp.]